jgi:sulfate transport system substrate-binding protein
MRNGFPTIFRDLGAWGYALKKPAGDEKQAREFQAKPYSDVLVLDTGGRGALTTWAGREISCGI